MLYKSLFQHHLFIFFLQENIFYLNQCFGSTSFWCGSADPLPGILDPDPKFFLLNTIFLSLWDYYSYVSNQKIISLKKYDILLIFVDFYVILSQFFCYPDPDPRSLKHWFEHFLSFSIFNMIFVCRTTRQAATWWGTSARRSTASRSTTFPASWQCHTVNER